MVIKLHIEKMKKPPRTMRDVHQLGELPMFFKGQVKLPPDRSGLYQSDIQDSGG